MKSKIFTLLIIPLLLIGLIVPQPAKAESGITIYVVSAITDEKILPTSSISDSYISNKISIIACPGEYEPASFVVRAHEDITSLEIQATNLVGTGSSIPSSNIDIRVVKCWYQAGYTIEDTAHKHLTPELLLKDDSLVKVENGENYLKLTTGEYVWISSPSGVPGVPIYPTVDQLPVMDSSTLQPVNIPANTNKQFWLTVKVPDDCPSGIYEGEIELRTAAGLIGELQLKLEVFPIELSQPYLTYSLFYQGSLYSAWPTGSIASPYKSEEQLRAEMTNMLEHGVHNVAVYQGLADKVLLGRYLSIKNEVGMGNQPLYLRSIRTNNPTDPASLEALRNTIEEIIDFTRPYGVTEVYISGIDEATGEVLTSQRPSWEVVHEAGGKVFVTGYKPGDLDAEGTFGLVGDIVDLNVCAFQPTSEEAANWHSLGHQIFSRANPQVGEEEPGTYRRNYGLLLWQTDYDGAMNWMYQWGAYNIWNDFDHSSFRDHNFTYPTMDGVIDTIQWEGWREGVDDMRYLSTLLNAIETAKGNGKDTSSAEAWLTALKNSDLKAVDLDAVRLEMTAYILSLLTDDTTPPTISLVTTSEITPISALITWTTDEPATSQVEYGITGDLGLSTGLDTALVLEHAASLVNLTFSTTYYYRVISGDVTGNQATSDTLSFSTPPPSPPSISFVAPTDADKAVVSRDWTEIHVSAESEYYTSSFIDWNRSLVGYWNFSENAGATANDKSTYGNNGTLINGPGWQPGKFGSALHFDGLNDYVDCGNSASLNLDGKDFTITLWIKPEIIYKYRSFFYRGYSNKGFIRSANDGMWFEVQDGSGSNTLKVPMSFVSDKWYFVAYVVKQNGEHKAWVYDENGLVAFASKPLNGLTRGADGNKLRLSATTGRTADQESQYAGLMDEVRVWNRALSEEEIEASYNTKLYTLSRQFTSLANGTYQYYAYTTDLTGLSARTETRTITIDTTAVNLPPVLNPVGNRAVSEGNLLTFAISASDPDGDSLTYSASNLPPGASFDPGSRTFSWTPGYGQAGVYSNIHFEVSDGSLTDSEDITITVNQPREGCDVNSDGAVNVLDLIRVGQHWGEVGSPGWIPEDVNRDGTVNVLDSILIGQYWTG
jgi:hypothetical protein